jgi:SAM-dependent methyltransferase
MTFKDHFSVQAAGYAEFRPRYPAELFHYLAQSASERKLAWDCATGNGQAALGLAAHFERVRATDASAKQIENAVPHPRIIYRVAAAERSGLESAACNLVTVAQALHWLDLQTFYAEVKRVLKDGGLLAVWSYNLLQITPGIDKVVNHFYKHAVGEFWPPERRLIESGYKGMPFPFEEIDVPVFAMRANWSLQSLLGYLRTWSATQRYMEAKGEDPVEQLHSELRVLWLNPEEKRRVSWPLSLRAGRHSG